MESNEQTNRWDARLVRIHNAPTIEVAGLAAEVFADVTGRQYVVERMSDPDLADNAWVLATWEVEDAARAGGGEWIGMAISWLQDGDAGWERSAYFCADVSWTARAAGNSALLHIDKSDLTLPVITAGERGLLHLLLQSQRYDFRFAAIRETVAGLGVAVEALDPFSRAIHAFALLGQSAPEATAEFDATSALGGSNEKVQHALLHGLWLAESLPDQAERILRFVDSTDVLRADDPVVALRKAHALRKLHRFDEALQSIDLGISQISPAALDVHRDFVRERSMIIAVRDTQAAYEQARHSLAEQVEEHVGALEGAVATKADQIEGKVSDSLFRMVEILALFTAVIALLAAGTASVTIGNLEWWQRGVLLVVAGAVMMIFFLAVRVVVRPRRRT
ncbi:hypothetical protein [Pseudonocardia sp. TRM90224]|uniref:hypothetical protein n=1 Tax=Pseudonocardia sp. TRM90224 TaxID=2812678 RepID=UPI001E34C177|nr:hypothetical protein [Pseudonocardia sp. TRM90224]